MPVSDQLHSKDLADSISLRLALPDKPAGLNQTELALVFEGQIGTACDVIGAKKTRDYK